MSGGDEPVMVWGDQDALHHVFENLLENAVKYSPPGSPVEIELVREERAVVVAITDHGSGIADEDLPFVFERFRQSGPTSSGGVGLGLYIVRTLVQAHGGVVSVRSRVGEGSTFSVSLPVRHAQREVAGAAAANGVTTA